MTTSFIEKRNGKLYRVTEVGGENITFECGQCGKKQTKYYAPSQIALQPNDGRVRFCNRDCRTLFMRSIKEAARNVIKTYTNEGAL